MKTKTIQTYSFSELSKEAKAVAIENNRLIDVEYCEWWYGVYDMAKENLEQLGYIKPEIYFSGFSSQGDGACFTCMVDLKLWIETKRLKTKYKKIYDNADEYAVEIQTSGSYSHENTMGIDWDYTTETPTISDHSIMADLSSLILEDAKAEARKIYKALEKEYEYLTSDEYLDIALSDEAFGDKEYLADGTQFN